MPPRGESQNALLADRQVRAVRFFWRFVGQVSDFVLGPKPMYDGDVTMVPARWVAPGLHHASPWRC